MRVELTGRIDNGRVRLAHDRGGHTDVCPHRVRRMAALGTTVRLQGAEVLPIGVDALCAMLPLQPERWDQFKMDAIMRVSRADGADAELLNDQSPLTLQVGTPVQLIGFRIGQFVDVLVLGGRWASCQVRLLRPLTDIAYPM